MNSPPEWFECANVLAESFRGRVCCHNGSSGAHIQAVVVATNQPRRSHSQSVSQSVSQSACGVQPSNPLMRTQLRLGLKPRPGEGEERGRIQSRPPPTTGRKATDRPLDITRGGPGFPPVMESARSTSYYTDGQRWLENCVRTLQNKTGMQGGNSTDSGRF